MRLLSAVWASCALCAPSMAQDLTRDFAETRLPGIEVYGDRAEGEPGAISILSIEEIEALRADHPAEVLNTLPGVNIQMNSGQEHLIAIRSPVLTSGAGQGSFLILENGVPTRAPAFGNVNSLFELHHETAGAIEVVRGPGSAKYGSNAVHGLINVIAPDTSGENSYSSVLSASTLQRYRGDWTLTGDFSGAETFAALSVQDDLGWRDNTGVDQQKATFRAAFDLGGWDAVAGLTATNLNQETGGFIQGPDAYEDEDIATSNPNPEAFRDAWSARANLRLSRDVGAGRLTFTPYALTQRMIFLQHFLPYQGLEKNGHDSAGLLSRYEMSAGGVDWTFGVDAGWADGFLRETQQRETFGSNDQFPQGVHYDYDVEVLSGALYAEADWKINEDWRVLAGLRGEAHEYSYETAIPPGILGRFQVSPDRDDDFGFVSPKLGVVYSGFDAAELYANYARGARAPQASDLYRIQSQQIPGDADVETLDSLEIGLRGQAF
ncbi:MAG: TonB-dependent receptor, partial [Pseudomonadota bacterium]